VKCYSQAWRVFNLKLSEPQSVESRQAALEAYRQAILAHGKHTLGELNTEFAYAFEQAKQLGRYYPRVQFELANNGIRAWSNLSFKQRLSALF